MKRNEFLTELRGLSADALEERARTLAEELMKLRFRKSTGQLEHSHRMEEVRRNLARVQTVLNQKRSESGAAA